MSADISKPKGTWELDDPDYRAPLVTIFGAGIAGLTVAHELVERGFHVQVVEPQESQFEEYECEVGGMAANQFSRVPAPLPVVHPDLPDVPKGELDRLRQIRRFYDYSHEFERAQPRFPIRQRLRFNKEVHRQLGRSLDEQVRRLANTVRRLDEQRQPVAPTDPGGLEEAEAIFRAAAPEVSLAGLERAGVEPEDPFGEPVPSDWKQYRDEHKISNLSKLQDILHIIKDAHLFYSTHYAKREHQAQTAHRQLAVSPRDRNRLREILLIRIIGCTDSDGLPEENRATGKDWADQVKTALIELNDKQRPEFQVKDLETHLETVGAGSSQLRGDADDPLSRTRSNRVEFQIVEQVLPGEHGFRFFPNFYRHLFDTMQRTPLLVDGDPEARLTAYDQLVPTPEAYLALQDDQPPFLARLRCFRTLVQIREALECFVGRLHFTTTDLTMFYVQFLRFMTSSRARRQQEAEDRSFIEYFRGPRDYSLAAQRFLNATPRALAAMSATETDARTQCDIAIQLMGRDVLQEHVDDMTLNGPTSEVWLRHWKRYLVRQGVRFFVGKLRELRLDGEDFIPVVDGPGAAMVPRAEDPRYQLRGRMLDRGGQPIVADPKTAGEGGGRQFYVLALPFERAAAIAEQARRAAGIPLQGPFQQLAEYADSSGRGPGLTQPRQRDPANGRPQTQDPLRDISGIQYFFPNNYRLGAGHVYWVDSPWALTSISQLAFWRDRVRPVGDYIGQLSVDLGDWYAPYPAADPDGKGEPGHPAWHSTASEIAQNCWEQVKAGLSPDHRSEINPPRYYHLDLGIRFFEEKYVGSHGNLILGISPPALRQRGPEGREPYRLLLIQSRPSEQRTEIDTVYDGTIQSDNISYDAKTAEPDNEIRDNPSLYLNKLAAALAIEINALQEGRFAFAVHEASRMATSELREAAGVPTDYQPPGPGEILLSPVISSDEIVIYFRGKSDHPCYVLLNGEELTVPPPSQQSIISYYVGSLQDKLASLREKGIGVTFPGPNHVMIKSAMPGQTITCAVANRDDMIEVVDGPRLEVKSRFPNIQVLRRPARTSGIGRVAAFRANALILADVPGPDDAVYPEPGREYRLSVWVETAAGRQVLAATHRAARNEGAAAVFDRLRQQLRDAAPAGLIHTERTEVGEDQEARPALLISPCAVATEILIRVTGASARPFKIVLDDVPLVVEGLEGATASQIRNRILEALTPQLAGAPDAGLVATAVGEQSLRLSRKAAPGSAPADRPIVAAVCNVDGMIELVGGPVVEVRTKDLRIDMTSREPVALRNDTPFQINPPGHWQRRPGHAPAGRPRQRAVPAFPGQAAEDAPVFEYGHPACPALASWIAAGTYMATYTRLTTMEAANESGRHAVNAILNQLLDDAGDATQAKGYAQRQRRLFGDYCRTWDVEDEEFEDLKFLKELDAALFAEGLPHVQDILPVQDWLCLGSDLGLMGRSRAPRLDDVALLGTLGGLIGPYLLTKSALHHLELIGDFLRSKAMKGDRR